MTDVSLADMLTSSIELDAMFPSAPTSLFMHDDIGGTANGSFQQQQEEEEEDRVVPIFVALDVYF